MSSIIAEGLYLAIYGMGTVFLFLALLVMATMLMSKLTVAFASEIATQGPTEIDAKKRAAIVAAIQQHRQGTGR